MRRPLISSSVVAAAAASLLTAGCGSGGSATASTPSAGAQSGTLAYSRCMHAHGVPNFPDPGSKGEIPKEKILPLVNSPQFNLAQRACLHVMPASGLGPQETPQQMRTRLADMLSFARCMHGRGVTRFPDPTAQGQLTIEMVQAQGIDVHSPAVLQDAYACLPASHGALTAATIRRALSEAGS